MDPFFNRGGPSWDAPFEVLSDGESDPFGCYVTFPYSEVETVSGLYSRVFPTCSFDQSFFSCPNEQFGCIERASTDAQSNDCLYPYPYPSALSHINTCFVKESSMSSFPKSLMDGILGYCLPIITLVSCL